MCMVLQHGHVDAADVQDVLYESQILPRHKHAGAVNGVILQVHMSSGGQHQEHRTTWCRVTATKRMGIQPLRYQALDDQEVIQGSW
jgi:hypothetical protein